MSIAITIETTSPVRLRLGYHSLCDVLKYLVMSTIAATNAPSSPAPVMTAATLTANLLKNDAMPIRQPPPIATHTSARMGWNSSFGDPPS